MPDSFDDPEFWKAMEDIGITRKPGMATELMREYAPLLADEGIDLDNLSESDLETLNDALARASERHNLELFTPVGRQRRQAITVLRDFSVALDSGDADLALDVLDEVEPEPTKDHPAISHVIGAGLGLLDTWFTDSGIHPPNKLTVPAWPGPARRVAGAILDRAQHGQAFDSLHDFHLSYGGLQIFHGTALAVAAVVWAVAASRGADIQDVANELLPEAGRSVLQAPAKTQVRLRAEPGRGNKKGRKVSGNPANRDLTPKDRTVLRDFGVWLSQQPDLAGQAADEVNTMRELVILARRMRINPHSASDIDDWVSDIVENEDSDLVSAEAVLLTLRDYARFRATSEEGSEWADAERSIAAKCGAVRTAGILLDVINAANEIDIEELRRAYASTQIVSAVPQFLEWIGSGRKVAPSGGVRRADIAEAAALIGVAAIGVNKLPRVEPVEPSLTPEDESRRTQAIPAMSMDDIPALAAWWRTLMILGVAELQSARMIPGPSAYDWLGDTLPPAEQAEMMIEAFIAVVLTNDLDDQTEYEGEAVALAMSYLMHAVSPDTGIELTTSLGPVLMPSVVRKLRQLELAGLVEFDKTGDVRVPPLLRGVIARGILLTVDGLDDLD